MQFKFVNWFLGHRGNSDLIGKIAEDCIRDPKFPIHARVFGDVFEYFEAKNMTKEELDCIRNCWEQFRTIGKVEIRTLNEIKSPWYVTQN